MDDGMSDVQLQVVLQWQYGRQHSSVQKWRLNHWRPFEGCVCGTRRHSGEHEHAFSVSGRGTRSPFKVCARYHRLLRASEGGEATGTFMGYSSVPCTRMGTAAAILQEARVLARDAWNCGMAEYERRKLARWRRESCLFLLPRHL